MQFDLLIKNGKCVIGDEIKDLDVGIKDGKIVKIAENISENSQTIIDAKGKHVLPGIIDSQVHFREPGLTHKEDLASGSLSAALGGVTTFLEMPNTNPATTSVARVVEKIEIAKEKCITNFGFFIGATGDNTEELIKAQELENCCGVKIFLGSSTGDLLLYQEDKLRDIFQKVKAPIALHSESEERLRERISIRDNAQDVHAHYEWRDELSAYNSTKRLLEIARECNKKVHVLHITTKSEMELLKENKDICTVEVTPQHLTLSAPEIYDEIGTLAQMNPPIRTKEHTDALWVGLLDGTVDMIGSDHAPHTLEEKQKGYPQSPSGMPGVQTILPIMLNHVNAGKLSLNQLVKFLSTNPAKLYSLNKGELVEGKDGDITIVDLNKTLTITNEMMATKSGWTPFHNKKITGFPSHTIVAGKIVMQNGEILE